MNSMFEDRERGYEAKWAHDQEALFKLMVRRNALLGEWAAGELRLSGPAADQYIQAVIFAGLTGKGSNPVFAKIRDDFCAGKINVPELIIHQKMKEYFDFASHELALL